MSPLRLSRSQLPVGVWCGRSRSGWRANNSHVRLQTPVSSAPSRHTAPGSSSPQPAHSLLPSAWNRLAHLNALSLVAPSQSFPTTTKVSLHSGHEVSTLTAIGIEPRQKQSGKAKEVAFEHESSGSGSEDDYVQERPSSSKPKKRVQRKRGDEENGARPQRKRKRAAPPPPPEEVNIDDLPPEEGEPSFKAGSGHMLMRMQRKRRA